MTKKVEGRREVASRNANWARRFAATLAKIGVSPNLISTFSIVFASVGLLGFYGAHAGFFSPMIGMLIVVFGIQLRLVMNLMDGMVAVEHGRKSAIGDLFNEIPDRISDTLLILGAGFVVAPTHHPWLLSGWAAGLALATAYLRTLGGALGLGQHFIGPMAKQHRMFLMTVTAVIYPFWSEAFYFSLALMNLGLVVTCIRRTLCLGTLLRKKREE